jgi:hypothetical protein
VDLGHRDRRGGGDPLLAGLPAPIRPGAHLPPLEETLGWTAPKIRSPQAADRWTWLVIAAHAQLRLARHLAVDLRRPREKPLPPERLTPARVRRGFRHLRAKISQPARAPKPTHPGPGRPPGVKNRHRATRYDVGKTVTRATANTSAQQVGG